MALKICKECGAEISKSAKVCPKCGKSQKNFFQRHIILTVILVILVLGIIVGATGDINNTNNDTNSIKTNSSTEKFSLISDEISTDSFGTTYIEGEIKNNTDKTYSYVQVTFNLYDSNGAQIGTAVDNINNLEPKGVWKYKAMGLTTEKVASYKFVEITGW